MESRFVKNGAGLLLNNYRKDKMMYLIAGLGNPTREYDKTRHNVGFSVIDVLADKYNIDVSDRKHKALCGRGVIEGEKVLLLKPQTFMNLSGQCVQPLLAWHKIRPDQLVVVHDELDIPAGELRFKKGGGNAGHNGLKSITQLLGTPDFYRLRIGIGRPPQKGDVINWVLGRPGSEDADKIRTATDKALEVLEIFAKKGLEAAVRATRS